MTKEVCMRVYLEEKEYEAFCEAIKQEGVKQRELVHDAVVMYLEENQYLNDWSE